MPYSYFNVAQLSTYLNRYWKKQSSSIAVGARDDVWTPRGAQTPCGPPATAVRRCQPWAVMTKAKRLVASLTRASTFQRCHGTPQWPGTSTRMTGPLPLKLGKHSCCVPPAALSWPTPGETEVEIFVPLGHSFFEINKLTMLQSQNFPPIFSPIFL